MSVVRSRVTAACTPSSAPDSQWPSTTAWCVWSGSSSYQGRDRKSARARVMYRAPGESSACSHPRPQNHSGLFPKRCPAAPERIAR